MRLKDLFVSGGRLLWGLGLVWSIGCGEAPEPGPGVEVLRATATTTQELSSTPPTQDPQLCSLPSGRYVISAQLTNTASVVNVTFHNDGLEGSQPSATCKTVKLVWNRGIDWPWQPPQPPPEADYPKVLLEGWWQNDLSPKVFAVKAVWYTQDQLGVITQIAGVQARGYAVAPGDLGAYEGYRFNWTGPGSDSNHAKYFFPFSIFSSTRRIFIADQSDAPYQSLYCQSGTTRLYGGLASNCPLTNP